MHYSDYKLQLNIKQYSNGECPDLETKSIGNIPKPLKKRNLVSGGKQPEGGIKVSMDYILQKKENSTISQLAEYLSQLTTIKQEELNFQNLKENQNSKNTLIQLELELTNSYGYYENLLGQQLTMLPEKYTKSTQLNPYHIVRALQILNISRKDIYLFFFGKLYCLLPLPPFWQRFYDPATNQEYFYYQMSQIQFFVHPAYFYLQDQITHMKINKFDIVNKNPIYYKQFRVMKFQDQLMREYEIDLQELIEESEQNLESQPEKKLNQKSKFQKQKKEKENEKMRQRYIKMKKIEELQGKIIYQAELINLQKELEKFDKENSFQEDLNSSRNSDDSNNSEKIQKAQAPEKDKINDMLLVQMSQLLYLPAQFKFLLGAIEDFILDKMKTDIWFYTINEDQKIRWVNKLNKRAIETYPHMHELKMYIDKLKEYYESQFDVSKQNAKTFKEHSLEDFKNFIAVDVIKNEAANFIAYLMQSKSENVIFDSIDDINYDFNLVYESLGLTSEDISKEQVIELLLFCPFNLEKDINFQPQSQNSVSTKQGNYHLPFKKVPVQKQKKKNINQVDFKEKRSIIDDILLEIKKAAQINQEENEIELKELQEKENQPLFPELNIKPTLKRSNTISPTKHGSKENLQKQFIYQRKMKKNNTISKIQSPKTTRSKSPTQTFQQEVQNGFEENTNKQRKKLSDILCLSDEESSHQDEKSQRNSIQSRNRMMSILYEQRTVTQITDQSEQIGSTSKLEETLNNTARQDTDQSRKRNATMKFQIELIPSSKKESQKIDNNSNSISSNNSLKDIKEKSSFVDLKLEKVKSIIEEQEEVLSPKKKNILKDLRGKIKSLLVQEKQKIQAIIQKFKQNKTINTSSNNISELVSDHKKTLDSIQTASENESFQNKKSLIFNDNEVHDDDSVIKEALDQMDELDKSEDEGPITKKKRVILTKSDTDIIRLLKTTKDLESPKNKWKKGNIFQLHRQMYRRIKRVKKPVIIENEYGLKPWATEISATDNDIKIIKDFLLQRAYLADESLNNIKVKDSNAVESDDSFSPPKNKMKSTNKIIKLKKQSKNESISPFARIKSAMAGVGMKPQIPSRVQSGVNKQITIKKKTKVDSANLNSKKIGTTNKSSQQMKEIERTYLQECMKVHKKNIKLVKRDEFKNIIEYEVSDYMSDYYFENDSDEQENPFKVKGSNDNSLELNFNYNILKYENFFHPKRPRQFRTKRFQEYFIKHKNIFDIILNENKLNFDKQFLNELDVSEYPNEDEEYVNYQPLEYEPVNNMNIQDQSIQQVNEIKLLNQPDFNKDSSNKNAQSPKINQQVVYTLPEYLLPKQDGVFIHISDLKNQKAQTFKNMFKVLSNKIHNICGNQQELQQNQRIRCNSSDKLVQDFSNCFRNTQFQPVQIQNQSQDRRGFLSITNSLNTLYPANSNTELRRGGENSIKYFIPKITSERSISKHRRSTSLFTGASSTADSQNNLRDSSKSLVLSRNCKNLCSYVILQTKVNGLMQGYEQGEYDKQFDFLINNLSIKIYKNYMDQLKEFIHSNALKKSFKIVLFNEINNLLIHYKQNNPDKNLRMFFKPDLEIQQQQPASQQLEPNLKCIILHSQNNREIKPIQSKLITSQSYKKLGTSLLSSDSKVQEKQNKIKQIVSTQNLPKSKLDFLKNVSSYVTLQNFPKII